MIICPLTLKKHFIIIPSHFHSFSLLSELHCTYIYVGITAIVKMMLMGKIHIGRADLCRIMYTPAEPENRELYICLGKLKKKNASKDCDFLFVITYSN